MKNKALLAIGLSSCALVWAAKDPIIMTVNGVDVTKSEFEYLYRKNNQQQIGEQSLEEYAEMFKVYKLKVADAITEGIDTTSAFKNEFRGYRSELAAPYMTDSAYIKKLTKEAYDRMTQEVEVSHIMLYKERGNIVANQKKKAELEDVRKQLIAGADFTEMAKKYSEDRAVTENGGYLGYISSLMYPYSFETVAYDLKEGEYSEVIESSVAYHILKGGKKRPARGTVLVQHVMKAIAPNAKPEHLAETEATMDSLYNLIVNGANFDEIATLNSDDKGSARQGGKLNWFGAGMMVPEFDSVSFALNVGEISRPFKTRYGIHIVKKLDAKDLAPFSELEGRIQSRVTHPQDERSQMIAEHTASKFAKEYKAKLNKNVVKEMKDYIAANGIDSVFYATYKTSPKADMEIYRCGDAQFTVLDFVDKFGKYKNDNTAIATDFFDVHLKLFKNRSTMEYADSQLENKHKDFRNLVNEYRDGMLLFEVSNRKVWEKASKDTDGLQKYFEDNRADYKWNKRHVKGYLVQVSNDSLAQVVKTRMQELGTDTLVNTIREEFPKIVKIDKILVAEGENAMVDNLVFGAAPVQPSNSRFSTYFLYDFELMDEPKELDDVKGQVTSDYQNYLEAEWIEELVAKYPVEVNEKNLRKVK